MRRGQIPRQRFYGALPQFRSAGQGASATFAMMRPDNSQCQLVRKQLVIGETFARGGVGFQFGEILRRMRA